MIFCNAFRTNRSQRILFGGVLCFVIAVLTSHFYHPTSDFSQGFVLGLTGVLFVAEIVLLLIYLLMQRRVAGSSRS